jgi:taurine transport system substrate-binding protein
MSQFSRRQILALSRNMAVASVAGGMLFPRGVLAQQQAINIGTFGSTDPQNFARATGAFQKLYGEAAKVDFVTVRAGSEVIAAMAGGSLDMCNIGSSPMVVGYANGIKLSMVWAYKNIIDSECLAVRKRAASRRSPISRAASSPCPSTPRCISRRSAA